MVVRPVRYRERKAGGVNHRPGDTRIRGRRQQ
jgi:hypothetical protein